MSPSPVIFAGTGAVVIPPTSPRYWVGGTGSWDQSTTTHWATTSGGAGGASVPTSLNDVIFDANSGAGTVTITASAPCNSIQSSGSTIATLVHNSGVAVSIGSATAGPSSIALDLSGFTTYTKGGSGSSSISFVSTSATQQTISYGTGHTVGNQTFNGAGGSWKLLSAMTETSAASSTLTLTAGTLTTNNFAVSMGQAALSGATTRALTLGTSTVTIDGAFAGAWTVATATGMTLSAASSTIVLTGACGAGTQIFRGGGLSYGTVQITGTGSAQITGANTFVNFQRSNAAACGLQLPSATTQTVTGTLTLSGASSGAIMTLTASTGASAATISIASATENFMSITDSTIIGAGPFHAGAGSTLVSNTTGWVVP